MEVQRVEQVDVDYRPQCCGDPHCEIRRGVRRDVPAESVLERIEQYDKAELERDTAG